MIPVKDNIPTERFPLVTVALILANFVVYILAIRHGGSFFTGPDNQEVLKYGAIPYALLHPGAHCALVGPVATPDQAKLLCNTMLLNQNHIPAENPLATWETVFTSMFMHASLLHIAGNMLFLWIFGNNVEDAMGHVKFLVFYLLGALAALALQVAVSPDSTAPTIGASGAIAAMLGGYIVMFPRARVLTLVFIVFFFTVIELPAIVMLGIWFAEQALFGALSQTNPAGSSGGVAYFAHVGGFVFGLLTIKLFAAERKWFRPAT